MSNLSQSSTSDNDENIKSIFECWTSALLHYFDIKGRVTRYEYWAFQTINVLIFGLWFLIVYLLDLNKIFLEVYLLYILFPSLAMSVKRLHDCRLSGWWVFPAGCLSILSLFDYEYGFLNTGVTLFLTLSYMTYLVWMLGFSSDKNENCYGNPIKEQGFYDSDSLIFRGFVFLFLGILWVAFFFRLFSAV